MTPESFVAKWDPSTLKESAGAQEHFIDLCRLVGVKTPAEADPEGEWFCFERGAKKAGGGDGWADVWRKGYFAWEYKGKRKSLVEAYKQLQRYAPALENPPLLIVSDMDRIEIHTSFMNTRQVRYAIPIRELIDPEKRRWIEAAFKDPDRLRPDETREYITAKAAEKFASLAEQLRSEGHERLRVAHFTTRLLFCMFAEDIGILPEHLFSQMLERARQAPEDFQGMAGDLFGAMHAGGRVGFDRVDWFNGGLFDDADALPLTREQIDLVLAAARLDWSAIEPSILGTLFERGMDPTKRGQLGAHYTDPETINKLVYPVVIEPLEQEWKETRVEIDKHVERAHRNKDPDTKKKNMRDAHGALHRFLLRLRKYTVLDPACGSGNFLYLALKSLKDLEHRVGLEAESLGLNPPIPDVGVANLRGIEINPYAAELARVTLWIGEIQWVLDHGFSLDKTPILKPLEQIEQRDALVTEDGEEAEWPSAEVIVGNPPFLGNKRMIGELGEDVVARIRQVYSTSVPDGADLVMYWFEKAARAIERGSCRRAGLVSTNSIRGGINRKILLRVSQRATLFNAWSDEPWINEGAAVRVSLVSIADPDESVVKTPRLDGVDTPVIHTDLTGQGVDLTRARKLRANQKCCFQGVKFLGPFDIEGQTARDWLDAANPHGQPNSDVLRQWFNGFDVTRRRVERWVIDFGTKMAHEEAALYEVPFAHVLENVKPVRAQSRRKSYREKWWLHAEARPSLRNAIGSLDRYIVTPEVAKHRLFVFVEGNSLPCGSIYSIPRADDETFGVLHSRIHEVWSLRQGTFIGKGNDPRYTPTSTFETFPFPQGLEPNRNPCDFDNPHSDAVATSAKALIELRDRWLNPPEWTVRIPEAVGGYPDRIVPKPGCEGKLKQRTLTNLYNERPAWLDHAHGRLDEAVAAAYGWEWPLDDEVMLARLLDLNFKRALV